MIDIRFRNVGSIGNRIDKGCDIQKIDDSISIDVSYCESTKETFVIDSGGVIQRLDLRDASVEIILQSNGHDRICCDTQGTKIVALGGAAEVELFQRIEMNQEFDQRGVFDVGDGAVDADFNDDGSRLGILGDGGVVVVFDVHSQNELLRLATNGQSNHPSRIRFSRNGKQLAATKGRDLSVWNGQ